MKKSELMLITRGKATKKKKIIKVMSLGAVCICVLGAAGKVGAQAYLSDNGFTSNIFDEGKVTIQLTEPNWTDNSYEPGNKKNVLPGDVFEKDPTVIADENCVTPSFVYIQVQIPYAKVTKVNDDSTLYDKDSNGSITLKNHMLLTFGEGEVAKDTADHFLVGEASKVIFDRESEILDSAAPPDGHNVTNNVHSGKDGWTLLSVEDVSMDQIKDNEFSQNVSGYLVFTYAYNSMIANTDKMAERFEALVGKVIFDKTTPLFNQVRTVNCIEGQLDGVEYKMPIRAFAIQATHTGTSDDENLNNSTDGNGNGIPATTKNVIEQAKLAYETYGNQNEDNGNAAISVSTFTN